MNPVTTVEKRSYAGLFTVTLATLMYEILLTRIFSVTMWYHFAFMAVSVAMFGMTVGAVAVYVLPKYFSQERAKYHLALSSLLFAISIVLSFLTHLCIPLFTPKISNAVYLVTTYIVISVPFIFSGICVCLALTKFPKQVSKLYAADLAGAALGCVLLAGTLEVIDGPTAVIAVAFVACVGSICFAASGFRKVARAAIVCSIVFGSFVIVHTAMTVRRSPLLRLTWIKGARRTERPVYEKWNAFSYIQVYGDPNAQGSAPWGWGLSPAYRSDNRRIAQLLMLIDATAGTILTGFDGNLNELEHLKYDVTNLAHYVRKDARVFAVGTGGGRDILAALVFDQKSVLGVEINEDIINAVNERFGDFTGHLDRNPKVTVVRDEARSYIARSSDMFDIIQVSLIDTWAATAAGAFVLTENSLYTVEAWKTFLQHLTAKGVLTLSRWYFQELPGEMYRLTSLASASLMQLGVENPREHIVVVKIATKGLKGVSGPDGVGTILVSREPFSNEDLDVVESICRDMQFDIILSPRFALDSTFAAIASGKDVDKLSATLPINIVPPTDDSPFFFHMLRIRDMFRRSPSQGSTSFNVQAVSVLGTLLVTVTALTILCVIVPLIVTRRALSFTSATPLLIFFAGIGLGFMLIEISQLQRLIVFLGHPTYSLTVVLFSLLVSSGIGSFATHKVDSLTIWSSTFARLSALLCVLLLFGAATPYAIRTFEESTTAVRILVSVAMLFPLGFFMGMPFPLGMKVASVKSAHITPWLWGINGATSVCGSVLAVVIAMSWGISSSFRTGILCYAVSFGAIIWQRRTQR